MVPTSGYRNIWGELKRFRFISILIFDFEIFLLSFDIVGITPQGTKEPDLMGVSHTGESDSTVCSTTPGGGVELSFCIYGKPANSKPFFSIL